MQGDGGEDEDEDEDEDHHPQERVSKSFGTSAAQGLDSHHVARFFLNPRQKKN
jgi:hypothetical protein